MRRSGVRASTAARNCGLRSNAAASAGLAATGASPVLPPAHHWDEPAWEEVAPGIFCKLMANDTTRHRVSMLVRLLPGVEYPPHTHAGVEELFLLDGELPDEVVAGGF